MQAIKTINGLPVEFRTELNAQLHLIYVRLVMGGGSGVALCWVDAMNMARECVRNRIEYETACAATDAAKEAARLERVAKHQAKQKRRAALESLKAKVARGVA